MKVVFAHDHQFYKIDDQFYSTGGLSREVLNRYTKNFKNLTILSRQRDLQETNVNLTLSSDDNIKFIKVPNINGKNYFKYYREANKIIENTIKDSDYLIARLPSTNGKLAIKFAKKNNIPYIIEVVGCSWDAYLNHGTFLGKLIAPYEYFEQKRLIRQASHVIYITKIFLQKRYPTIGKTEICPNVNIKPVQKNVLQNRLNSINNQQKLKIGLVGSLDVDYKGHEMLLRALHLIKNQINYFEVNFLGGGNPERWKKLISDLNLNDNVAFIGTLPNGKKVFEWMDQMSIMVQPSSAEAQGRSIIEAMSRGCPIVSTKVGGIVELIDEDYLVESGDYKELAKKIISILDKKNMRAQAIRNFDESTEYYKDKIELKREKFFLDFINDNA